MSIPYWRNKNYTDDGCSVYQCLSCYRTWEARTPPQKEGWNTGFVYCPCCGIKWEGGIESKDEKWEHDFYNKQFEKQKEIEKKKRWWVILVGETEHEQNLRAEYRIEAGGRFPTKAIRNWFLDYKDFYLNRCHMHYKVVKMVFSKDIKKDFPYDRYISEVPEYQIMRFMNNLSENGNN